MQQHEQPLQVGADVTNNINEIVSLLNAEDAMFLTQLSGHILSTNFTANDQHAVYDLLRYAIMDRSVLCFKSMAVSRVDELCLESFDSMTMVLDIAKPYAQCVLAQNMMSRARMGDLVMGKSQLNLMWHGELLRIILAMGGAFHKPAIEFMVRRQETMCIGTVNVVCFDTTYCVDPESFFLVVTGTECV